MDGGRHVILDVITPKAKHKRKWLTDHIPVAQLFEAAARIAGGTVVKQIWHTFEGGGYTGLVLLKESHFAIHTFPEANYAAIDLFMCGKADPLLAMNKILADLFTLKVAYTTVPRNPDFIKMKVTNED